MSKDVCIICKEHGEFFQRALGHIRKNGCSKCSNTYQYTNEEFIEKANQVHKNKFEYTKTKYSSCNKKVIIICKNHGEFSQTASLHLHGHGCPKCAFEFISVNNKHTLEEFVNKAKLVHGDKYSYENVIYEGSKKNVNINFKVHGSFMQCPASHLTGYGCMPCANIQISKMNLKTKEQFIKKAIEVRGNLYNYEKVIYKGYLEDVIIICNKHGEFIQKPRLHINKHCNGCPMCDSPRHYSQVQIAWLNFISKLYKINIKHAENGSEFSIPNTRFKADGYCLESNTVYEFHGDYWHGNPKIFPSNGKTFFNKTFGELYEKTLLKEKQIKDLGFSLVVMWENDWNKINKSIKNYK